ncbi:hypothetical protein [Vreelandella glaciei]|uniref:hypothetical protein n=1 Tax=Vreelandella glaciei TaxID=186761 RepID=UPI0030EB9377|tara:strand:+ start:30061 stop:30762 length:702 start_codon:yes stop_codon:yes gene_type:complete
MNYEAWRATFQSSEQAAQAAFQDAQRNHEMLLNTLTRRQPRPYLKATCAEGTTHRIYSRVQPGDRIYVKEAHAFVPEPAYRRSKGIIQTINPDDDYEACVYRENFDRARSFPWRPSIFMPRWAARLVFDVVSVRLERLQDICDQDSKAEGCQALEGCKWHTFEEAEAGISMHEHTAKDAFSALWESINGPESWQSNPPVWIYDLQPVGIKPATMPSQGAPTTCTLPGGDHASD